MKTARSAAGAGARTPGHSARRGAARSEPPHTTSARDGSDHGRLELLLRRLAEAFASRSLHHWRAYARSTGLSMPQFILLLQLFHGSRGVNDIGAFLEISSPAASQLVDRLVNAGLAERAESREDRRAKRISISRRGRELIARGLAAHVGWAADLAKAIRPADRPAVVKALPALLEAEGRFALHAPGAHAAESPGKGDKASAKTSLPARSS